MEETYKIRKDRVKNIAIIFLTVMLVLTFFSNSILNRSLPEVATSYVERGTITEKVRGSGMVQAQDPYKIVATGIRTIASVPIKEGDTVTKDQILFQLEDEDSEELKTAEADLDKLILTYTSALLNGEISNESFNTIEHGSLDSVAAYQAQIEAARQKVKNAQATVDSIKRQQLLASNDTELDNTTDLTEATAKRDAASAKMSDAQSRLSTAKTELSTILAKPSEDGGNYGLEELKTEVSNKQLAMDSAKTAYTTEKTKLIAVFSGVTVENVDLSASIKACFDEANYGLPVNPDAIGKVRELIEKMNSTEWSAKYNDAKTAYEALFGAYNSASIDNSKAYGTLANAVDEYNQVNTVLTRYNQLSTDVTNAENEYKAAKSNYDNWVNKVAQLTGEIASSENDNKEYQATLNINLADAEAALKKAQDEQTQLLTDVGKELDLSSQNSIIAEKQKEIEKLREETVGATIVSPVDGTVLSVTKVAGEKTAADEEIATIQVAGKDMIVSFAVTKEQAAKVKVGDKGTLQNSWYYDNVNVTLSKIKPDKDNPNTNKLLEFTVEGDVQNGESLGIELGQRSKDYDHVVPNSAVREDKNGKFILIIQEKSTPFGNRYKAKRINVEVLASDETNTAIGVEGELQGYEYVITTSNKPVEPGAQVRLAEY